MSVNIKLNKKDLARIRERIKKQIEVMKNTAEPMAQASVILYQSVIKNFREQGTDKEKWQALSPVTLALRRKGKGKGTPRILEDTGMLRMSIASEADNDTATVGTNLGYAKKHQFGGRIGKAMIPARPFLVLRENSHQKLIKLMENWFYKKAEA